MNVLNSMCNKKSLCASSNVGLHGNQEKKNERLLRVRKVEHKKKARYYGCIEDNETST